MLEDPIHVDFRLARRDKESQVGLQQCGQCRGNSRVDFVLEKPDITEPLPIELHTLPGALGTDQFLETVEQGRADAPLERILPGNRLTQPLERVLDTTGNPGLRIRQSSIKVEENDSWRSGGSRHGVGVESAWSRRGVGMRRRSTQRSTQRSVCVPMRPAIRFRSR